MRRLVALVASFTVSVAAAVAFEGTAGAQTFVSATAYSSIGDSPFFANLAVGADFQLEDFEDGAANTSYFTIAGDANVVVRGPSGITDSVDLDDYAFDGSGTGGSSLANPVTGVVTLLFQNPGGGFPTKVGVVWTDGAEASACTVTVIDSLGNLASSTYVNLGDASANGETAEDRFLGVTWLNGIQSVTVASSGFSLEIDHVQYNTPRGGYHDDLGDPSNGSDLFWHKAATGIGSVWLMNGLVKVGGGTWNQSVPSTYVGQGLIDTNLDFYADAVFRDSVSNLFYIWRLQGQNVIGTSQIGNTGFVATTSQVVGVGDFDGDRHGDLLFVRSTDNSVRWWQIVDGAKLGGGQIVLLAGRDFLGVADLDGDGKDDFLMRDPATGIVTAALVSNGIAVKDTPIGGVGPVGSQWALQATGDLNGDGRDDLIWRNTATGVVNGWIMNGLYRAQGGGIGTIPLAWTLECTTDLNGDGMEDLVWTNTGNGQVNAWLMNGLVKTGGGNVSTLNLNQWALLNH